MPEKRTKENEIRCNMKEVFEKKYNHYLKHKSEVNLIAAVLAANNYYADTKQNRKPPKNYEMIAADTCDTCPFSSWTSKDKRLKVSACESYIKSCYKSLGKVVTSSRIRIKK